MEAALPEEKPYYFRPYKKSDVALISHSWGTSCYGSMKGITLIPPSEFHKRHKPKRDKILASPNVAIIVCASKEDEDLILGYIIIEKIKDIPITILHFIYVKHSFQNEGIGKNLIKRAVLTRPVLCTHETLDSASIMQSYEEREKQLFFDRFFYTPHLF